MLSSCRLFGRCAMALACTVVFFSFSYAQRLSGSVVPEHYQLSLTPDLKTAAFSGGEKIDVSVKQPTDSITLNAAEIKFQNVSTELNGKQLNAQVSEDPQKQQATFHFDTTLPAGHYLLSIEYSGILNNELRGFYLSKTARRNYAVTQFESTDARRAFPSFDEPAFKASFDISLVVDKGDTAISNTNIVSDMPGPGTDKHTLHFAPTPKMSTYLVAFLIGDFQCTSGQSDGIPIRACATPDKVQYTKFALSAAEFVLHYYDTYFGIKYPMPKLDMIALPDFEAGAMENFGAITYRETDLLIDPANASVGARKNVAEVVAHEMAHQWFGDMVTMQWWNNIWLNEGFATWMENKPVAAWRSEWNIPQDVAAQLNGTLNLDARRVTRTIRAKADTPDEINEMFDGISYGKAGAMLLMVENYEGKEVFRKGVHNYLEAHKFANATAEDFWNAQTVASGKPIDKIMESFVAQPGEPVISFQAPQGSIVAATQQRFFINPSVKNDQPQTWSIPVCVDAGEGGEKCDVLNSAQQGLNIPATPVFFPDAEGKGYYRFALPDSVYNSVLGHIETALTPEERIALIGNVWAGVSADRSSVGAYLDLSAAVKDDSSAAVIGTALDSVVTVRERVASNEEERRAIDAWIIRNFKPPYERLGPPSSSDSPDKKELRATLFAALGGAQDPEVIAQSKQMAQQYFTNPTSVVDATLALTAAGIAAAHGDAALFDQLQQAFETSKNPEIQEGALRLLAEFQNPELEQRALNFAVSGKVRNQDAIIQLLISLRAPETRDMAWQFIQQNWDKVMAQSTISMGGYLVGGAGSFCSAQKRDEVVQFFTAHKVRASQRALTRAKDQINDCIQLREEQEPKLQQWMATHK